MAVLFFQLDRNDCHCLILCVDYDRVKCYRSILFSFDPFHWLYWDHLTSIKNQFLKMNCLYIWHIVRLTMWHRLFLEFSLVHIWFLAHWRHQRAVTLLENICQLNIIRSKKLGFPLSHTLPLSSSSANSPNVKTVALKLRTSAIPSNIPVDCAAMHSSGNAFPSILWSKEALFVFFTFQMMPASA